MVSGDDSGGIYGARTRFRKKDAYHSSVWALFYIRQRLPPLTASALGRFRAFRLCRRSVSLPF